MRHHPLGGVTTDAGSDVTNEAASPAAIAAA
jgi:hypothetical protein